MCTSNFIGSAWSCCYIILILFLEFKCERDLENLESLGLEGGLYDIIYFVKLLSLELERDLYLGRELCRYGDLYEDLYGER